MYRILEMFQSLLDVMKFCDIASPSLGYPIFHLSSYISGGAQLSLRYNLSSFLRRGLFLCGFQVSQCLRLVTALCQGHKYVR